LILTSGSGSRHSPTSIWESWFFGFLFFQEKKTDWV